VIVRLIHDQPGPSPQPTCGDSAAQPAAPACSTTVSTTVMTGPRRREDFDVLIQLRAVLPVMRHAVEISEIDSRKRIIEATKRRWAAKRAAETSGRSVQTKSAVPPKSSPAASGAAKPAPVGAKTTARKGHISPQGRKKLAEAMKRRWAAKRVAEASTTAVSSKKAAPTKRGARSKKTATA
jgi:hypothetical protein